MIIAMDIYGEEILDHAKNPRNFGELKDSTHKHEEFNELCGDRVEIFLKINAGKMVDVKWRGEGCAICMAGASLITEDIKEIKNLKEIKKLNGDELLQKMGFEGLSPARVRCALLGWEGIRAIINDKN